MARARKDIAGRRRGDRAEAPAAGAVASGGAAAMPALSSQPMLALSGLPLQHREQILALVRAMARDAARADHAAERQGDDA